MRSVGRLVALRTRRIGGGPVLLDRANGFDQHATDGIQAGRRIVYRKETPMSNLFLTMMDRMGTQVEHFGDATGRLAGLDLA